jgi:pre-mRNA 3'-end-processing factor FIP1
MLNCFAQNFSGMPEDQVNALPPEVRQMVMTGTVAMMNAQQNGAGMMNPMMDMSAMNMMPGAMMMDMNMGGMMAPGMDGNPDGEGFPGMDFTGGMQVRRTLRML